MTLLERRKCFHSMMILLQTRSIFLFYSPHFQLLPQSFNLFISCTYVEKSSAFQLITVYVFMFFQGLTLDERGRFTGEAEKKLEEVLF